MREHSNEWRADEGPLAAASGHCARVNTVGPDGLGRPPEGSRVTDTPVTGRERLGGTSRAIVARPAMSGSKTPTLTGAPPVNNQI